MANKFTTGNSFSTGDQVTAAKLNESINSATFDTGAVDDATTEISSGAIIVKDAGITNAKLATNAVTTAKITDSNVTKAKIENVANMKALGNVSGSAAAPAEVAILDEDNMASNSATSLATQQSIKAYADSKVDGTGAGSFTTLAASGVVSVPDGSESVPSITNTGDTNTGIYFPAENSVALTAGAGATLTSTNTAITINVPTSIVSTAQSDLTLQGGDANSKNLIFKKASAQQGKIAAVGDELKFYAGTSGTESLEITTTGVVIPVDLTVDTTTLKVDSTNNRVGIGTASPSQLLDVNGQARVVGNLFVGTDDTTPNGLIEVYGGGTGQNEGGEIHLRTAADFDTTYNHYFIDAYEDDLRIGREGGADITLASDGNIGIGIGLPTEKLQVVGNVRIGDGGGVDDDLILKGSDGIGPSSVGGSTSAAIITTNGIPTAAGHVGIEVPSNDNDDGFYVATDPNQTGTADLLALKINALGNVGIGETSPSAPLTVTSTTGGVILPRMTTTQMNAISSPANGEMIYNTTDNKFYGYANGAWVALH